MSELVEKATEIFCIVDDLFLAIEDFFPKSIPWMNKNTNRGRSSIWGPTEVVTLSILEFLNNSSEIKAFFRLAKPQLEDVFKSWISYDRYVQLRNMYAPYAAVFLYWLMEPLKKAGVFFVDSTPLEVCHIRRASTHKVMVDFAKKSKTTKGWFFGLKLHLVINSKKEIVALHITPGNVDDREPLMKLFRNLKGMAVGDAGYLSKKWLKFFKKLGLHFFTGVRKNMKKVITGPQHLLLKSRQHIESVFSILKTRYKIVRSLPRSVMGHMANYLYGLLAYCLKDTAKYYRPIS